MIHWVLTALFASILLSCSAARYIAACILGTCFCVCLYLSWPHAFQKRLFNRIYKREFSCVSKGTNPIFDPRDSASNILNRRWITLHYFVQRVGKRKKKKDNRCCKALYLNTQAQKLAKVFENICILITFIQPKYFLNWF